MPISISIRQKEPERAKEFVDDYFNELSETLRDVAEKKRSLEKQPKKEVTTSARLLSQIRHLHPELSFCGEPKNAILKVPDALLNYVLSLLKNDPVQPPQVSIAQWRELLHILESHWIISLLYWYAGRLPDGFRP